jgi:Ca-activated chloride channel homolog
MARLFLILVGMFLLLVSLNAQTTGTMTGRVLDGEGKALIGATIVLEGTKQGGLSKAPEGRFTIAGIRAGDYTVKISGLALQTVKRAVRIVVGQTTDLGTVTLRSAAMSTESVAIIARREPVMREKVTTTRTVTTESAAPRSVAKEDLERSTRTTIVDAVAMQGAVDTRGQNGITIHGGRTPETSVRVDGVEVSDPFAGGYATIYPTASTLGVQEVQVVPNPVSAEYGDVISGIVNSTSTTAPTDDVAGESYAKIYENEFLACHVSPISTFSIDVDRASYSNIRRFLNGGTKPPADAVRIEEMINYFDYDYADPTDEHPFAIHTEMSDCPWDRTHRLVRVGLQGKRMEDVNLPPSNLTFLIDVSGSMSDANKLPLLQQGFKLLVDQLRPEDNVAIVVYAGAAGEVLPMTSGRNKAAILDAINRLSAGGSTAGGAGIELAYKIARDNFRKEGNNRVILATDGDFNVGVASEADLVTLIEERRKDGVFLTVLGFGTGNYQDAKMEQLADKGNGNYAYIDNLDEAKKVFVDELSATLHAIAKDVKVQVLFSPERVASYRLIGYENRMLATEDFDNDLKDAGELGAGHSVTALYEIVPRGSESADLDGWVGRKDTLDLPGDWQKNEMMRIRLRYKLPESDVSTLIEGPVIDRGVGLASSSADFRFAAAVAEFGLILRNSRHKGSSGYDDVLLLANAAKGSDVNGYRAEFIALVERARSTMTASR